MQASGSSGPALSNQQARQALVCKGRKQHGREEEKTKKVELEKQTGVITKVAPIVTGVAISLQGFAGTKLWITADQNSIAEPCQLQPLGLFHRKVWVGQILRIGQPAGLGTCLYPVSPDTRA